MTISSAISSACSRIITFPLYRRNLAPFNISVPLPPTTTLCLSSSATFKKPVLVACLKQNQEPVHELRKSKEKAETAEDKSLTAEIKKKLITEIKKKLIDLAIIALAFHVSDSLAKVTSVWFFHFFAVFTFICNFLIEMKPHYEEHKWIIDAVKNLYEFWNFVTSYLKKKQEEEETKAKSVEEEKKKEEMKKAESVEEMKKAETVEEEKKIN